MEATNKGKTSEIEFLGSMTHDSTSLRGRIAVITYQNLSHSHIADKIMIFIEHLQSSFLFIISNYRVFKERNPASLNIATLVYTTLASLNPASYLTLEKANTRTVLITLLFAFLLFLFRMLIFGYIVWIAWKKKSPSKNIQFIWQWIFKLQPRVLYFIFAPLWSGLIEATVYELLDLKEGPNLFLRYFSILMFVLEFIFSFALQTQFTCILPNKSFLSSKNNSTQILTLLQKFLNQLVRRTFYFAPTGLIWIANFIVFGLSIIKLFCYFHYLPYYKVSCLFYELYFIVIVFCLSLACTLQVVFGQSTIDMNLVIGIWFVLSILGLKVSVAYLKNKLSNLALFNKKAPPGVLVHKIIAAKYFLKPVKDDGWRNLVKVSLTQNIEKAFNLNSGNNDQIDLNNKDSKNKMFSIYLERLLVEFPKNDFIRLYAAYHFANKQRLYGKSMRTINELKRVTSWNNNASTSILFQQMKHKIILESKNSTFLFDLAEFIQSTSLFAQAKVQILKQMEIQEMVYKEMKQPSPLLAKISNLGNKVADMKKKIEANRKRLFQAIPEYYLEPLLLYAHYYLILNHSYEKFTQFHSMYSNKRQKYAKTFAMDNFCQENFYKKNSSFMILSGEKQIPGRVLYCGGNYMETFGRNISGQYCGVAVPKITAMDPKALFNSILENGEMAVLNRVAKRYYYHQNGHMTQIEYFFNVSPFLSQGLTYYVVFRPVKTHEECILINREGFIESYTKGIGEQLNLSCSITSTEEKNIENICPELQLVNEAFNVIAQPVVKNKATTPDTVNVKAKGKSFFVKKGPIMSLEDAQDICSSFADGTQILHLEGLKSGSRYTYRCCKIVPWPNNPYGAKEIYLERIIEKNSKETLNEMSKLVDNTNGELPERRRASIRPDDSEEDRCPDEKELGWINFQTLDGGTGPLKTTAPDAIFPTIQSPTSSSRHQLLSTRSIKPIHQRRESRTFTPGTTPYPNFESVVTEYEKVQEIESFSNALSRQESVFSLKSEFVAKSKIKKQKIFEQANSTTYILPKYKFLTLMGFCVVGTVFLLQQILNFSIKNGFDDLEANKEIVLASESRNYLFSYLNVIICFIYGQAMSIFQVNDLLPILNLGFFKGFLHIAAENLTVTNSHLFGIANSLNDAQREILFQRNVRIYETEDKYNEFTTFQAVNQMIETALRVESQVLVNLTKTIPDLIFIGNNLMHDLSVRGNAITDLFFENLQDRKDSFLNSLLITFLSITIIPIGGLIVANSFVYAQYRTDINNLLAFTKINKQTVDHVLKNLSHFKAFIEQNTNFEDTLKEEQYMQLLRNNIDSYKNLKNQAIDNQQSPDSKGFAKPYLWIIWIIFVMLMQITLSFLIYYLIFTKNLKNLGNKAYQLYFLERTASKIIALRGATFEMVLLNDMGHVFNEVTSVFVSKTIVELQEAQHELEIIFGSENSDNNELVQNIMFRDACAYLEDQITVYNSCKKLGNYQNRVSWINLISNIRQLYQNYLNKYLASDKSATTLLQLQKDFVRNIMSPTITVSTAVNTLLTESVDEEFTKLNLASKTWNNRMPFIYLAVVLITIKLGIWDVILPLNEKEMRFRQLLLLFPANVVLANFMLKQYLLKVSRGAFDSIRNEI